MSLGLTARLLSPKLTRSNRILSEQEIVRLALFGTTLLHEDIVLVLLVILESGWKVEKVG